MSMADTAEDFWAHKKYQSRERKRVFTHKIGLDCGHFHINETKKNKNVDCYACLKLLGSANAETWEPKCQFCHNENVVRCNDLPTTTYTCPVCHIVRVSKGDDVLERLRAYKQKNSKQVSNKCDCGGNMIKRRNGSTGESFYGCSNYPKCKNTKQPCQN